MILEKFFGPATAVYLASASIAALWWASDLSRRVQTIEHSTVTGERLARLETEVHALAQGTHELKLSVNELARELRKK